MAADHVFVNSLNTPNFSHLFVEPNEGNFPPLLDMNGKSDSSMERFDLAKIILSIFICVLGIFGNIIVVFVIVVLKEYSKSVTHWYVLQLAIADSLFLLTLPFKISEDLRDEWIYSEWMCKANETILFFNYYASCLFLMVMSIDRYIAVCKAFSEPWQKLRKRYSAFLIAVIIWTIAILLCTPVMLYSFKQGIEPNCKCSYEFPIELEDDDCSFFLEENNLSSYEECIELADEDSGRCKSVSQMAFSRISDLINSNLDANTSNYFNIPDYESYDSSSILNLPNESPVVPEANSYQLSECNYSDQLKYFKVFLLFNFVVMFLLPFLIMFVCYGLIVRRLSKSAVQSNTPNSVSFTQSTNNGSKKQFRKKMSSRSSRDRKRVTVMCAALVSTFLFCWLPFHAVHIAKIVGISNTEANTCQALVAVGTLFGFLNSALNPYLYSFLGTNFSRRWSSASRSFRQSLSGRRTSSSSSVFGPPGSKTKRFRNVSTSTIKTSVTKSPSFT